MPLLAANFAAELTLRLMESRTRDDRALEEEVLGLFDLMQSRLLPYAVAFGISAADGEDIVQETFLDLFHHLQSGRSRANLASWLFWVTHNLALKKRAKGRLEVGGLVLEETECFDPDPDPEERMLMSERHSKLQSILRVLPMNDQLCLRLRAEGLPYREIAKVVGISLGSVSASPSRSLTRLQAVDRR